MEIKERFTNHTMKALQFNGNLRLIDLALPQNKDEALVKVSLAGICNTDIEITRGYAAFNGTLGHEFVGIVTDAPQSEWIGKRVVGEINAGCGECDDCLRQDSRHCPKRTVLGIVNRDGAFAEYLSLPCQNLLAVPDSIPDHVAVFTEPLAAACAITEQVTIEPGARVAVIGDGKLGLLIAQVLNLLPCHLLLIGKHPEKLAIAQRSGIKVETISEISKQTSAFDYIVEASGANSAMEMALRLIRPRGTIILKSTYASTLTIDPTPIVVREIKLLGSRCGRFTSALELLQTNRVEVTPLITETFPLIEAEKAFAYAQQPGVLKVLLKP